MAAECVNHSATKAGHFEKVVFQEIYRNKNYAARRQLQESFLILILMTLLEKSQKYSYAENQADEANKLLVNISFH